jgi:hypothetical protein
MAVLKHTYKRVSKMELSFLEVTYEAMIATTAVLFTFSTAAKTSS